MNIYVRWILRKRINQIWQNLQSRPCPTHPTRHVLKVENDKAMVVRLPAGNAHAAPPRVGRHVARVHSHIHAAVLDADKTATLRCGLINIIDEAIGGVRILIRSAMAPASHPTVAP